MKNDYDHHNHQCIYTYNLSVPKRFTLDVPNQSPSLLLLHLAGNEKLHIHKLMPALQVSLFLAEAIAKLAAFGKDKQDPWTIISTAS